MAVAAVFGWCYVAACGNDAVNAAVAEGQNTFQLLLLLLLLLLLQLLRLLRLLVLLV